MKPAVCPSPGESAAVERVVAALQAQMRADYPPKAMKRDAHPKAHGTVVAELIVDRGVSADLRQGVFSKPGRNYRALIRFSNCFGIQPDVLGDTRGMAMKLLGVEGDTFMPDERGTQDFLGGTHDAFFIPDALSYIGFPEAARAGGFAIIKFFVRRRMWSGLRALAASAGTLAMNPLAIAYFSQTPYRLGDDETIKFQMRPALSAPLGESLPWVPWFRLKARIGETILRLGQLTGLKELSTRLCALVEDPDLLRHAMARSLRQNDAWFEFLVQRRRGGMPTEDATASWDQAVSPYERVAWIRIPRQVFTPDHATTDAERQAARAMEITGENLSFNPWHALPDHEPLGSINRARRRTNGASSETRHTLNEVPLGAPSVADFDRLAEMARLAPSSVDACPDADPATFTSRWAYLYLRRVPLLTALAVVLFPIASVWGPLSGYTHGIFDVNGPILALVSLLGFLLAFTIMTTWWTITAYADRRAYAVRKFAVYPIRGRWYLASAALMLPLVASTLAVVDRAAWTAADWATTLAAWGAGLAAALAIAWTVRWLADWFGGMEPVQRWARYASASATLGDGYVDRARQTFLPGHLFASGLMLVTIAIYLTIGRHTQAQAMPPFPALVFLLLLPTIVCCVLSAVTFFFDRFRALTLTTIVIALVLANDRCGTRHVFQLEGDIASAAPRPAEVLAARSVGDGRGIRLDDRGIRLQPDPSAVIVVTVSGGGAQSAAWSARALTGLVERCRDAGCRADEAIRLISATSGGSVGALHFANAYDNGQLPDSLDEIRRQASKSSQDALWRSLVYRDLYRPLRVWRWTLSPVDRGLALEAAWAGALTRTATLASWSDDARVGRRPGVIFNATLRGREDTRLQISTAGVAPGAVDFREHYGQRDVPMARAARLSASFPVVVPFASDSRGVDERLVVDGGYTDQFGVEAAVAWLKEALAGGQSAGARVTRVMFVQLRAPTPPPSALAPMPRWIDQLERDQRGLALLQREWAGRVGISSVTLPLCARPSSGWHSTESERAEIDRQWAHDVNGDAANAVVQFLKGEGPFAVSTASINLAALCPAN